MKKKDRGRKRFEFYSFLLQSARHEIVDCTYKKAVPFERVIAGFFFLIPNRALEQWSQLLKTGTYQVFFMHC